MDRFIRAGKAFEQLCRTMAKLRAPGGCAWDREQTLQSLKQYLIEETYETLEAVDKGDPDNHREELGDLLLQIVFQAEITQEDGHFDVADVADGIDAKLVRRHPHVFGDRSADTAAVALENWEEVKARERSADQGCLDGIPRAMPALLRAQRTGEKAAAVGFDWPDAGGVIDKVREECRELSELLDGRSDDAALHARRKEEMGDLLFALVSLCRHMSVDPEDALAAAVDKFHGRFRHIETTLARADKLPRDVPLEELERLWNQAKAGLQKQ